MTKKNPHKARGFTLIELLVVTAIVVVITGVVLANNAAFGGRVALENLAYDIALTLRQTQGYGISTARSASGSFKTGFGVHVVANASSYIVYGDLNGNGAYDAGESIPPSPYNIGQGYKIGQLCVTLSGGTETCGYSTLDVWFFRPEPDACVGMNGAPSGTLNDEGNAYCLSSNQGARVEVRSPRNDSMHVVVEANGQIAIQ
jgi:prepilin-type N-terminal cleavage/methylation domain-containing protein